MLHERKVDFNELEYEKLQEIYLKAFKTGIPFNWIGWKEKAKTEKEFIILCLKKGKPWYEIIKPVEEGVEIDYKKGSAVNG